MKLFDDLPTPYAWFAKFLLIILFAIILLEILYILVRDSELAGVFCVLPAIMTLVLFIYIVFMPDK